MTAAEVLQYLQQKIHTTVAATTGQDGLPVTCALDLMDGDENGLYFLTAKGKNFYDRLKANENMAFTAMKGEDTLSCVAVSVQGKAKEIGPQRLPDLFCKNPYMEQIYPDARSRSALTAVSYTHLDVYKRQVGGSVDEKLQTCDFKRKQYQKLMSQVNIDVEYIYLLSDWFKNPKYKDVLDYIISMRCHYYFEYIPLTKLGLPVPPNHEEE